MSYDIHLEIDVRTGGPEPYRAYPADIGNYTSNVSGMWTEALGYPLADLDGHTARAHIAALQLAVDDMEFRRAHYQAMSPSNGWGSYDGALRYLRKLAEACAAHPNATIRVSH
ncbi:hypothetical protein [Streptomyces sp. NPDC088925]|uniref:hypothetical protein n=1 Tax=Streptomyces sp. NPDC088925 TaxID=3365914 RepID=UPI003814B834